MELSIDNFSATPIKLLSNNNPPPMRRIEIRVEPDVYEEILGIAHHEGIEIAVTIRQLLAFSLSYYQRTTEAAQAQGAELSVAIADLASFALTFYHKTREISQSLDMDTSDVVGEMATFALTYYKKAKEIAIHEGMDITSTADELSSYALRYYEFRRGTLNETRNEALPEKNKMFHCQICQKETNVRRKHRVSALNEEYVCCEDCFFADRHKTLISIMVNR